MDTELPSGVIEMLWMSSRPLTCTPSNGEPCYVNFTSTKNGRQCAVPRCYLRASPLCTTFSSIPFYLEKPSYRSTQGHQRGYRCHVIFNSKNGKSQKISHNRWLNVTLFRYNVYSKTSEQSSSYWQDIHEILLSKKASCRILSLMISLQKNKIITVCGCRFTDVCVCSYMHTFFKGVDLHAPNC